MRTKRGTVLTVTGMLLAAGLLGACSDSGGGGDVATAGKSSSTAPDGTKKPTDPVEQGRKFAECLRDHGVDVQDPDPGTGQVTGIGQSGASQETMKKALDACQDLAPQGTRTTEPPTGKELDNAKKFSRCMRDEGFEDFPDPGPDGNVNADIDRTDPKASAALQECSQKYPANGVDGGGQ